MRICLLLLALLAATSFSLSAMAEDAKVVQPSVSQSQSYQVTGEFTSGLPAVIVLTPLQEAHLYFQSGKIQLALGTTAKYGLSYIDVGFTDESLKAALTEYDKQTEKIATGIVKLRKKALIKNATEGDIASYANAEKGLAERYSASAVLWAQYLERIKVPIPLSDAEAAATKAP